MQNAMQTQTPIDWLAQELQELQELWCWSSLAERLACETATATATAGNGQWLATV